MFTIDDLLKYWPILLTFFNLYPIIMTSKFKDLFATKKELGELSENQKELRKDFTALQKNNHDVEINITKLLERSEHTGKGIDRIEAMVKRQDDYLRRTGNKE